MSSVSSPISSIKMIEIAYAFNTKPNRTNIFNKFSLEIEEGLSTAILGRSGVGKTTLLNIIQGIYSPQRGEVAVPTMFRPLVSVPQGNTLLPWRTIEGNISLGNELMGNWKDSSYLSEVAHLFELDQCLQLYPFQISGGMARKVLVARSLVIRPRTIILDEPFSSLDYPQRINLIKSIRAIQKKERMTIIFVTHEAEEAILLADRIVVLGGLPATVVLDIPNPIIPKSADSVPTVRSLPQFSEISELLWSSIGG